MDNQGDIRHRDINPLCRSTVKGEGGRKERGGETVKGRGRVVRMRRGEGVRCSRDGDGEGVCVSVWSSTVLIGRDV